MCPRILGKTTLALAIKKTNTKVHKTQ